MVSKKLIDKQLKKIGFNQNGWGRGEASELPHIILDDEEIYECVNGIYDGGFALLVATDIRVLLIDKKPLNFLTVEDLRFDMISEMDYSHRLFGARISISAGDKNLKFLSYNQPRLRKLIGHVQDCMAQSKKKQSNHAEGQVQHLEKINEQLQEYLLAQQRQQSTIQEQLSAQASGSSSNSSDFKLPEPIEPSPELKDYLFAQSLLAQHQMQTGMPAQMAVPEQIVAQPAPVQPSIIAASTSSATDDLVEEGKREIFGKYAHIPSLPNLSNAFEVNPIKIAYSKLPTALHNRKFGQPSIRASILDKIPQNQQAQPNG